MSNAIYKAERRLALAKKIAAELSGKTNWLSIERIGAYTIVEDGMDKWIEETERYEESCEEFIDAVLDGKYDNDLDDIDFGQRHERIDWYSDFCQECGCMYSKIGRPSDEQQLYEVISDLKYCNKILDTLGIDPEEIEDE